MRVALGAAPRQLITQLMAESLVLSGCGAAVGVLTTLAALPLIVNFTPVDIPRLEEAGVNIRALGLCLGVVGGVLGVPCASQKAAWRRYILSPWPMICLARRNSTSWGIGSGRARRTRPTYAH